MLRSPLNAYAGVTAEYDALAATVAVRYGSSAQAVVFVLYEELIRLRTIYAADPAATVVAARIGGLRRQIQQLYTLSTFPPLPVAPVRVVARGPVVVEFDRSVFTDRYGSVAGKVLAQVVEVTGPRLAPLRSGVPYMFVVDDERRLLVWDRPFRFQDLVFGRNRATVDGVPVAHPMLVPARLRATAAGEIVFIGDDWVRAATVNTKSGHFRPPPSSAQVIRELLSDVLALTSRDLDLFTLELPDRGPDDGEDGR